MRILVLGSGGREHAIGWKLKKDYKEAEFFFAPGNAGTEKLGLNLSINPNDPYEVASVCSELKIDLVFPGPENPLSYGVKDILEKEGKMCFGPSQSAAQLEASKSFAKKIMEEARIPTAPFKIYTLDDFKSGKLNPEKIKTPIVIKASGLCAGKGTFVCKASTDVQTALEKIFIKREFGDQGNEIIVEEFLEGEEISYFALCSNNEFRFIGFARDYKRLMDNDQGPNTGGMGAYTPVEYGTEELRNKIEKYIVSPLMEELHRRKILYTGILYIGIMIHKNTPYVLEFNVRLGDPEAQVILPCIKDNFADIVIQASEGKLPQRINSEGSALCIVMASQGYPDKYKKGVEIKIKGEEESDEFIIFHAGTKRDNGKIVSSGGRVLNVVGLGKTKYEAKLNAYNKIKDINFEGAHFRKDIGS